MKITQGCVLMSLLIILNIISSNPIPSAQPFTAEMVAAGYGGMAAGYMMTAAGSIMAAALLAKGLLLGSLFQPDKKKEVPVHVHYYRRYGGYAGQYGGYAGQYG